MALPPEYAPLGPTEGLMIWFNQVVTDLSKLNSDFYVFRRSWGSLTAEQKAALRAKLCADIAAQSAQLDLIKTEITGVPD